MIILFIIFIYNSTQGRAESFSWLLPPHIVVSLMAAKHGYFTVQVRQAHKATGLPT
ncbi:hypothetical protein [Acetobacter fabarum]|uniref:hypothetical protein n=1 Tax=Acetobacter fabarum TaxID=483199 RepID=UPI0039E74E9A